MLRYDENYEFLAQLEKFYSIRCSLIMQLHWATGVFLTASEIRQAYWEKNVGSLRTPGLSSSEGDMKPEHIRSRLIRVGGNYGGLIKKRKYDGSLHAVISKK